MPPRSLRWDGAVLGSFASRVGQGPPEIPAWRPYPLEHDKSNYTAQEPKFILERYEGTGLLRIDRRKDFSEEEAVREAEKTEEAKEKNRNKAERDVVIARERIPDVLAHLEANPGASRDDVESLGGTKSVLFRALTLAIGGDLIEDQRTNRHNYHLTEKGRAHLAGNIDTAEAGEPAEQSVIPPESL